MGPPMARTPVLGVFDVNSKSVFYVPTKLFSRSYFIHRLTHFNRMPYIDFFAKFHKSVFCFVARWSEAKLRGYK